MRRATPLAIALLLAVVASAVAPSNTLAAAPAAGTGASMPGAFAPAAGRPLSAAGRYIVLLKDGESVTAATGRAGRLGVAADRTFRHAVHGFSARLSPSQLASLRSDPAVEVVVPDELISLTAQSTPTGVRRVNTQESQIAGLGTSGPGVDADVAIVDTGIDKDHEDLNIAGGVSCSTDNPNSWGDPNGHGTHVAGIVGAKDNGFGVVGVAPGVRLWSVRILDSAGNGLISWYVCGLDWITAQRDPEDPSRPLIEAVNMSVAKSGSDDGNCGYVNKDAIHQAICRLVDSGVTVVAAAGNNSFNAKRLRPASYDEVITVSALADTDGKAGGTGGALCYSWGTYDRDDTFADFSNYGQDVDLIAPGKCIYSTLPTTSSGAERYGYLSGTSMAAPHVTGAAALYKASRPDATPAQVRVALRAAGTDDWKLSSDPDSVHEPLLDVSHIVNLGDFTIDTTPGKQHSTLVGAAGGEFDVPVRVFRAEDFPARIDLSVHIPDPLGAVVADPRLTGLDATATTVRISVPAEVPSGTYKLKVTASDGTRERTSTYPVVVDSRGPTAKAATLSLAKGGRLPSGVKTRAVWPSASDPSGSITRYEARWVVDGNAGSKVSLSPSSRTLTRYTKPGQEVSIRVRARDSAGNWGAWADSDVLAPALVQDTSDSLERTGDWRQATKTAYSGGSALYTTSKGAEVTRQFTGRAVAWVGTKGARRGKAAVFIDGTRVAVVDLRRSSVRYQVVLFARSWASAGDHTITIRVKGTKGRPRVDVDALVIVP
jgi:subtilisin family serine protease